MPFKGLAMLLKTGYKPSYTVLKQKRIFNTPACFLYKLPLQSVTYELD